MNYTTYLFDFDYTLADSSRGIVTCFRNVLTRHGYTAVTDDEIKRTIGKTLEESFSLLTGVTDAGQLAGFKAEYRKEADTHMTVNTVLFPETKSVLTALKASGARIGIISTKYRFRIRELLDQHFPADFMDIIVGGEDVEAAKPSPEGLLFAIGQLHVGKAETLYIGDSTVDAETARAAGVDFAGVTHGVTTAQELEKYPHRRIMGSLEELLRPRTGHATPVRKKRWISIWQIILLAFLLWMAIEEPDMTDDTYLFSFVFLLALWGTVRRRKILPDRARASIGTRWRPYATRLRAFRIKLARGRKTPPASHEACTCLNCGTTYTGNYCSRCGQNRNTSRYRLSNVLRNIAGGFFNIDNGFGRTLFELLYRPGYMIRDFISGKRVEYFRPFQTLFILAALYIMAVQLVDPEALNPKEKTEETEQTEQASLKKTAEAQKPLTRQTEGAYSRPEEMNDSTAVTQASEEDEAINGFVDELTKDTSEVGDKLEKFLQRHPFLMKVWNLLKSWGHGNKAFRIIATLPLFALATQLAFRRRNRQQNYNTTEHVFIQAYIACQILLLSILVLPLNGYAKVDDLYELPLWFIFALFCWDYKQLYRCTWWRSFWHTLLMLAYCGMLLLAFASLVIALIWIFASIF